MFSLFVLIGAFTPTNACLLNAMTYTKSVNSIFIGMFVYKVSFICTDNIIIHTIMRIKIDFGANAKCQKLDAPFPPKGVPAGTFGGNKYETSHNGEGTTKRPPPSHGARPTPWFDSGILPTEFGS